MSHNALKAWHNVVKTRNSQTLDELLHDDVVFHSPVVHTPQKGRAITKAYLTAAFQVFFNDTFHYVREIADDENAVLEFEVNIGGTYVNGVDMIRWNDEGRITDFKVMIRPLQAIQLIHEHMGKMLARSSDHKPS
ncbi:nuclear transport factor 2 family protein [Marinobacteraceae bacterium S3BR75-40.1]